MYFGFWFCFVFCAPLNVVYEGGGGAKEECKSRGSAGALLSGSAPFCSSVLNVLVMSDSCDPMGCSPPPSVHGVYQAAILEWVIISFSRGSSWPRDRTQVSHIADRFFSVWATREALLLWRYFSIFTGLCNYQHNLNLKHFHHQRRKPGVHAHSSRPPLSPSNHWFTFSEIFAYSGYFISNVLIQRVVFCAWLFT